MVAVTSTASGIHDSEKEFGNMIVPFQYFIWLKEFGQRNKEDSSSQIQLL